MPLPGRRGCRCWAPGPATYQVDQLRYLQWKHVNDILDHPLDVSYQARIIDNFHWADWIDSAKAMPKTHPRSDTRLKNYPYRPRPVSGPK